MIKVDKTTRFLPLLASYITDAGGAFFINLVIEIANRK